MARVSKIPLYENFNAAKNCFGENTSNGWDWQSYLPSAKKLFLELGCGKAEVSMGLAQYYPQHNYIGVDLKADRLWRPAKQSLQKSIDNIAFMQANILSLNEHFEDNAIDGIWITFPDPFPKKRQVKHRMFNRNFLDVYKQLLKKGATIRFKTDNMDLFYWALELLVAQEDIELRKLSFNLHASELPQEYKFITTYEQKFLNLGQPIYFTEFIFS